MKRFFDACPERIAGTKYADAYEKCAYCPAADAAPPVDAPPPPPPDAAGPTTCPPKTVWCALSQVCCEKPHYEPGAKDCSCPGAPPPVDAAPVPVPDAAPPATIWAECCSDSPICTLSGQKCCFVPPATGAAPEIVCRTTCPEARHCALDLSSCLPPPYTPAMVDCPE